MRWRRNSTTTLACCTLLVCGGDLRAQEAMVAASSASIENGTELAERLERLLDDPALTRAHVGLIVQVAETGEVLFASEAERRFTPASNTKIVTAAVALEELGADYRWPTRLVAAGPISGGRLEGSLWVIGSGAPELKRAEVAAWASALREAGVAEIAGDVVGDDRAFEAPQWGIGWMWDDLHAGWASGVSGLQLHPSTARAHLFPGTEVGEPVQLRFRASDMPIAMENRVRTGAPDSEVQLRFVPPPEGGTVELRGWIPANADSVALFLAPQHPTLYLLRHLGKVLADSGIAVAGEVRRVREGEAPTDSTWGHEFLSDSLGAVLADLLKPSDNQMAESVLRTLGYEEGTSGSDL
jgi:D-alanyl-D-alanine carboxypeptidase/D-alanyl-D-alanine-endopeptidase (penicillin-binding protein 4)